ncbi:MAG: DUF4143 domain-containing protein [Mycoplasma sp.]
MNKYRKRIVEEFIEKKLNKKRFLLIVGPKWCGKTTTGKQICNSFVDLQDETRNLVNNELSRSEIDILLDKPKPLLIDEWQEVPAIWNVVKRNVDNAKENKVDYILTGSTIPVENKKINPAVGRVIKIKMSTMSLYETGESSGEVSLNDLLDPKYKISCSSKLNIDKLLFYICRGGWPELLFEENDFDDLLSTPKDYIEYLLQNDLQLFKKRYSYSLAHNILLSYARNISTVDSFKTTYKTLINDLALANIEVTDKTIASYIKIFKNLYILEDVNAWTPNIRSKTKIKMSSKKIFSDTSFACGLLNLTPPVLKRNIRTLGFFFENFVAHELNVYLNNRGYLQYYRDDYGLECDFILNFNDGLYGLVEVKLGDSEINKAISNMEQIHELLIAKNKKIKNEFQKLPYPNFMLVITGINERGYTTKSKHGIPIHVVPIDCLKN